MRILMTTDTIGGVWTFTRELSIALLGFDCAVALVSFGRPPSAAQSSWAAEQRAKWGDCFYFAASDAPLEWMDNNQHAYVAGESLLLKIMDDFKSDLFLSSQFCFGALPCKSPRVLVAHSDVLSWARACQPTGLPASSWLERYRALVARGLQEADAVVAPTRWMLDALSANFRLPNNISVIPNGRTTDCDDKELPRRLQAVTAGRLWDKAKNLHVLADVQPGMPLIIAGEVEHESSRFAGTLSQATLLGQLDERELLALFRSSSIYICTSCYEPFGLAPLEAALCGCAVIAADIPSLREIWGESALYFQNAQALTALLARLRHNPHLLAQARTSAKARAQQFTPHRMAERYLDLFRTLPSRAPSSQYAA